MQNHHTNSDEHLVPEHDACPRCGQRDVDQLIWIDDEQVRCADCGTVYEPGKEADDAAEA